MKVYEMNYTKSKSVSMVEDALDLALQAHSAILDANKPLFSAEELGQDEYIALGAAFAALKGLNEYIGAAKNFVAAKGY